MKMRLFPLVLCLLISSVFSLSAQINVEKKVDQYLKKGERKVERRVDRTIDRKTDEALDTVFDGKKKKKKKKKNKNQESSSPQQSEASSLPPTQYYKLEDLKEMKENEFIGTFTVTISVARGGVSQPLEDKTRNYFFLKNGTAVQYTLPGNDPVTVIYNLERNTMTTVKNTPNGKVAFILNKPVSKRLAYSSGSVKINPLPAKKVLDGQECQKFMIETPDDFITAWVAIDPDLASYNYDMLLLPTLAPEQTSPEILKVSSNYGIMGVPMEMTLESKISDEVLTMRLTSFKPGPVLASVFDISGADVTDMTKY